MKSRKLHPVFAAIFSGDLATLRLAIEAGEDMDAVDPDGRTPLFHAAIDGRIDLVSELVGAGCKVNVKDKGGKTPLHLAAVQGQFESAKALLRGGAVVDSVDEDGNTPLSDAVFYSKGRGHIIRLLLKHGADAHLKNKHGVSPKELAESIDNYDVRQFFQ